MATCPACKLEVSDLDTHLLEDAPDCLREVEMHGLEAE